MTPKLFGIWVKAKVRAAENEQHGRAWLAWHTAALPLLKTFPKLNELMGVKKTAKAMSQDEIAATFKRVFGR